MRSDLGGKMGAEKYAISAGRSLGKKIGEGGILGTWARVCSGNFPTAPIFLPYPGATRSLNPSRYGAVPCPDDLRSRVTSLHSAENPLDQKNPAP